MFQRANKRIIGDGGSHKRSEDLDESSIRMWGLPKSCQEQRWIREPLGLGLLDGVLCMLFFLTTSWEGSLGVGWRPFSHTHSAFSCLLISANFHFFTAESPSRNASGFKRNFFGCTPWHVGPQFPSEGLNPYPLHWAWSINHWTMGKIPLSRPCLITIFHVL